MDAAGDGSAGDGSAGVPVALSSGARQRVLWLMLALLLLATVVRLGLAAFAPHPGIADSNHYYNLAHNLLDGRGLVIDYIWHYHRPPATVTHPIDYWMPLTAVASAGSMALLGDSLFVALLPAVLFGVLAAALAVVPGLLAGDGPHVRVWSLLAVLFVPQMMAAATRTDTTVYYAVFVAAALLAFYRGMRGRPVWLFVAGCATGLAYLTRQDAVLLLPALLLSALLLWRMRLTTARWYATGWTLLGVALVVGPWLWRNVQVLGTPFLSTTTRTMFTTSFDEQFSYSATLDLQHYLSLGVGRIVGNWLFMALANIRSLFTTMDVMLPVLVGIGLLVLWSGRQHNRERFGVLVPSMVYLLVLFLFYSFVTPFHTQGGSFFKSSMFILPWWGWLAATGVASITTVRWGNRLLALGAAAMLFNSLALVRDDYALRARYDTSLQAVQPVIRQAGDVDGDGRITVMAQDPYIFSQYGFDALMLPFDPLDVILDVATRYGVDYIILPPNREALNGFVNDSLATGQRHPRLTWLPATDSFQLLRVEPVSSAAAGDE